MIENENPFDVLHASFQDKFSRLVTEIQATVADKIKLDTLYSERKYESVRIFLDELTEIKREKIQRGLDNGELVSSIEYSKFRKLENEFLNFLDKFEDLKDEVRK